MIGIIDYEIGNLRSVEKAVQQVGGDSMFVRTKDDLAKVSGLILPGVGAFGDCVKGLRATGLWDSVLSWIGQDRPFFGICVGYQMLFEGSAESTDQTGLGVFKGSSVRFKAGELKVPHMGWNQLKIKAETPYLDGIVEGDHVYFVHSYYAVPEDPQVVALSSDYGVAFPCAVAKGNLFGTQFHPEKSQRVGLKLVENFVKLVSKKS
jgi:imidazole glycerol-phosphate synthase subunit HisH